jgi:hypothetical protein
MPPQAARKIKINPKMVAIIRLARELMFGENELNLAVEIDAASCRQLRLSVASRWIGPGTLRTGAASRRGCVIMAASSKGLCCPPSGVPCVRVFEQQ